MEALAKKRGISPAQLALSWVLGWAKHLVTIPATRSAKRLDENVAAAQITLTAGDVAALEQAFPKGAAHGSRYPEPTARFIDR